MSNGLQFSFKKDKGINDIKITIVYSHPCCTLLSWKLISFCRSIHKYAVCQLAQINIKCQPWDVYIMETIISLFWLYLPIFLTHGFCILFLIIKTIMCTEMWCSSWSNTLNIEEYGSRAYVLRWVGGSLDQYYWFIIKHHWHTHTLCW